MNTVKNIFVAAVWGLISFIVVFFIIPETMVATPDILWITLCIALPALLALYMFKDKGTHPCFIFAGLVVQVALMLLLPNSVARQWGMSLSGLGAFEYISLFIYPVAQTAISFVLLKIAHKKAE